MQHKRSVGNGVGAELVSVANAQVWKASGIPLAFLVTLTRRSRQYGIKAWRVGTAGRFIVQWHLETLVVAVPVNTDRPEAHLKRGAAEAE